MKSNLSIERLFDLPARGNSRFPDEIAFCSRKNGHWIKYSYAEYFEKSNLVSFALLNAGVRKGDKIVTISRNRAEFNFVDMGIMQIGAIHVPLYPTISDEKLIRILKDLACSVVFAGNKHVYDKLKTFKHKISSLRHIISFDEIPGAVTFDSFLRTGIENQDYFLLEVIKNQISPNDISSITYISGNSTEAKGIVHSHSGQVQNILALAESTSITWETSLLSLLPLAHIYERSINYLTQYVGATVWYNENFGMLEHEFHQIRPDVIFTVPLLLEKLYNFLISKTRRENKLHKFLFGKAIDFALGNDISKENTFDKLTKKCFDVFLYSSFRKILGGNLQMIYCGGAGLDDRLRRFVENIGIPCYEGYGLSEGGVVAHNFKGHCKPGTLGKPVSNNLLSIAEDGELLIKSPSVLKGFFGRTGKHTHSLDAAGWLHTGDTATLDTEGYLKLTGTKKRIFKLSSGIYSDPLAIEKALTTSAIIRQAFVFGINCDFLLAIISPDFEYIKTISPQVFADGNDFKQICGSEAMKSLIHKEISNYNSGNRQSEHIGKFLVVADGWTKEDGLLDALGDPVREKLSGKYRSEIDLLYQKAAFRFRK